jgi:O-antigen/teichoic acid export membrane protein
VLTHFYAHRDGDPRRPAFGALRKMRRSAATHHAFNLALRTPELLMPIVVVALLSAATNASFYVAWMIAGFLFVVPLSLTTVLYAVGSGDRRRLEERLRMTLAVSVGFGLIANLVLLAAGGLVLDAFGSEYAGAASALQILALGVFPETIRTHYVAVRRIDRRIASALPVVWGGTVLELAGGTAGALLGGLTGVAAGWLTAVCIEALVMGGDVIGAIRPARQRVAEPGRVVSVLASERADVSEPVGAE